jgi:DNA-directed RNA polymerase subunit RPC12/RpoP
MTGEKTSDVFKVTAKAQPVAPGHYQGWLCLECKTPIPVLDDPNSGKTGIAFLGPADAHVRLACPHCGAERLYGLNERVKIQVKAP